LIPQQLATGVEDLRGGDLLKAQRLSRFSREAFLEKLLPAGGARKLTSYHSKKLRIRIRPRESRDPRSENSHDRDPQGGSDVHRPAVITNEKMAVLEQGRHLLEALAFWRKNAGRTGHGSDLRNRGKIGPGSKQEGSSSVVSYQSRRHFAEPLRMPGTRRLRGAWMQGDS
jgi:hypothetical protein